MCQRSATTARFIEKFLQQKITLVRKVSLNAGIKGHPALNVSKKYQKNVANESAIVGGVGIHNSLTREGPDAENNRMRGIKKAGTT